MKARFLVDLWRYGAGVDARPSFGQQDRFGLWESPTGLHFFDPMIEGDGAFYTQFYSRMLKRKVWAQNCIRREFEMAARSIREGERVLDVGCGFGQFRHSIPHANYTGLDPHFADGSGIDGIRNETLERHLADHAGTYDAVCAFQVLEHLASPARMFADMVHAARPGGLLIIGVPHVPSALTRIPNFVMNAPPHHLSWWTRSALAALAERNGAAVVSIENVPWGTCDALFYWIERCSPLRCTDIYYRNRISWHAAAIVGFLAGRVLQRLRHVSETTDEGVGLLMVAQRAH